MIFRPELARKIARGEKTQTRRPVKPGEKHCRYREGRDYAVQPGRGKPSSFRILILAVEDQALGDLTYRDARAEGFKTRDEFQAYWAGLYGSYDPGQPVWAIRFRLHTDQPRLLIPGRPFREDPKAEQRPEVERDRGYTTDFHQAMRDEPEAIDEQTQQRYAKHAREKERTTSQDVWRESRADLTRALDRLKAMAPGHRITREIREIEQRILRLDDRYAA